MTDIDFDELDKAVNSLMETSTQTGIEPTSVAAATPAAQQAATPGAAPAAATVTQAVPKPADLVQPKPSSAPVATQSVRPSLATKRSGRFMDVVHPSSDMRSADRPSVPTRTASSIAPINDVAPTPVAVPAPTDTAPQASVSSEDTYQLSEPSTSRVEDTMPDPLDYVQKKTAEQPAAQPLASSDEELLDSQLEDDLKTIESTGINDSSLPAAMPESDDYAGSPFIPDAKVEKRPLGNPTSDAVAEQAESPGVDTAIKEQEAPSESLPPELHEDVTKIEASTTKASPVLDTLGSTSISQQYKEVKGEGVPEHQALYDTATATTTIAHPAKKKSGWMWVLWTVLLMLLGAGGAVAAYYMKLI